MSKKIKRAASTVTVLLLAAWVIGYFWGTRFEAYEVALGVVRSSPVVAEHIGPGASARIALFDGYRVSSVGTETEATYRLVVSGEKGSGVFDLALSRKVGRWSIVDGNLSVNGGPTIALKPGEIPSGEDL